MGQPLLQEQWNFIDGYCKNVMIEQDQYRLCFSPGLSDNGAVFLGSLIPGWLCFCAVHKGMIRVLNSTEHACIAPIFISGVLFSLKHVCFKLIEVLCLRL